MVRRALVHALSASLMLVRAARVFQLWLGLLVLVRAPLEYGQRASGFLEQHAKHVVLGQVVEVSCGQRQCDTIWAASHTTAEPPTATRLREETARGGHRHRHERNAETRTAAKVGAQVVTNRADADAKEKPTVANFHATIAHHNAIRRARQAPAAFAPRRYRTSLHELYISTSNDQVEAPQGGLWPRRNVTESCHVWATLRQTFDGASLFALVTEQMQAPWLCGQVWVPGLRLRRFRNHAAARLLFDLGQQRALVVLQLYDIDGVHRDNKARLPLEHARHLGADGLLTRLLPAHDQ
mmetsp:Transcript_25963/g.72474  ORF Transcript_25963/g.72474 Transcript_25963/m.72474 type:complete len:296 (-) Transcript_25963:314-1201(-)